MADYLESYASQMLLPVQSGVEVERVLAAEDDSREFVVVVKGQHLRAKQVVVATGAYQSPKIPEFAKEIAPEIRQLHSSEYRNPAQLQQGDVLVVGAGNSGAEIALDVAHKHPTILSGRSTGFSPFRPESAIAVIINTLLAPIITRVISVDTSIGRKLRSQFRGHGQPVVRVKADDLNSAGVERINTRVQGVEAGKPKMADGRVLDVGNIIWCTGFHRDFSLIELPIFDDEEYPLEYRGVVPTVPGIYFVGLVFQSSILSTQIGGVGKDAKYIAKEIAARRNASKAARAD